MHFRITLATLAASFSLSVGGQSYPANPVRLIVPFPPGGTVDITARAIASALSEALVSTRFRLDVHSRT